MEVKLKKPMPAVDFSQSLWKHLMLAPGLYELQEVVNPAAGFAVKWWALKGKMIGAAIPVWQMHLERGRREI